MLAAFWLRSLPAHDARLSLVIAAALWLSVFASLQSEYRARARLSRPGLGDWRHRRSPRGFRARLDHAANNTPLVFSTLALMAAIPVLTTVTIAGAGGHNLPAVFENTVVRIWPETWGAVPIASADLIDAEIAIRPADWRDPEIARRRFRVDWCADAGIPEHACETPRYPDQELARQSWCDTLEIDDCAGRFREIDQTFAAEWQIEWKAYLGNIRGPDLRNRDLRNTFALGAFLAGLDLREARLEGTTFFRALLEGANLREARLNGANLVEARLGEANLINAWLERANLREARLNGADLMEARLNAANLIDARLDGANLLEARIEGADLRRARLEGTTLFKARLDGADLREARLEGSNLLWARLEGANLRGAKLQSVEWAGATLGALPAHSADFTGGKNLTQTQLAQVIGNDDTILPRDVETGEQLYVWSCWEEKAAEAFVALYLAYRDEPSQEEARDSLRNMGWVCSPENPSRPVGTPAEPALPAAE